ncbi:MAG: hydroxymethylglutaryl-CoA lyase [Saprospiraceae bacterium]|jgi:hydroxymethylglutaryl-CoA lyase|nr:hydroxymethylglutaryl-CoA lyase [Saprospiraceae bacterium]MBK8296022.1 hydroxymethylglutaryl-CoA lyase [Saprospiraceae bacterium]
MSHSIKLIECPRDAMQGLHDFVPTDLKIKYLQQLIDTGFDALDFGSFVSVKAIPQMQDTHQVVEHLNLEDSNTKLIAIVANKRGAEEAILYPQIRFVGYPFSVSETFQIRNTNSSIPDSVERIKQIQELCSKSGKQMLIYISMAFGNPYGDPWNAEIVLHWVDALYKLGINTVALSDTIGVAEPESIRYLFSHLIPVYPQIEFGAHFHTVPELWEEKLIAAFESGCYRFDGAIYGYGGCPMAKDDLTGNMPTEHLISYFKSRGLINHINLDNFSDSMITAKKIFDTYH